MREMTNLRKGKEMIVFGSPVIGEEEVAEMVATLRSGWIGTGPKVKQFEDMFAEYVGAKHAVAVNSCTAALHLSMIASGIGPGDEVITTPMTFCATSNAILHAGATPVYVDVDPDTMNINANNIAAAITPKTKGILPVHFAGRPCDMGKICKIADEYNLLVIEDAAHCIEGKYKDQKIGSISPLTCFSFYVTKNLVTGEGGMITTDDEELAKKLKMYALHGLSSDAWSRFSDKGYKHYQVSMLGYKYNMTDMQASLGIHQLPRVDQQLVRRNEIWDAYDEAFSDLNITIPSPEEKDTVHARHLYTILLDESKCGKARDQVLLELHNLGIGTGVHYTALHLHPYYIETLGYKKGDFPHAEYIGETTLSLPLSAKLADDDVSRIIESVRVVLKAE